MEPSNYIIINKKILALMANHKNLLTQDAINGNKFFIGSDDNILLGLNNMVEEKCILS